MAGMVDLPSSARALLEADCIALDAAAAKGDEVLQLAARLLQENHGLRRANVLERLRRREQRGSTGQGWGVAIPHADMPGLRRPVAAFVRTRAPVSFNAPDRELVRDFLVLVVPRPASAQHFDMLAHYRQLFASARFRESLSQSVVLPAVWRLFREHQWVGPRAVAAPSIMGAHSTGQAC